jgi:hypothetical protein
MKKVADLIVEAVPALDAHRSMAVFRKNSLGSKPLKCALLGLEGKLRKP